MLISGDRTRAYVASVAKAHFEAGWSIADIAARTYVPTSSALHVLQGLQRRGLAAVDESGQHFRFSPSSDEERQVVLQTGVAYRTHLVSIATFIHQKAATPVQEFARAFDLKKDR